MLLATKSSSASTSCLVARISLIAIGILAVTSLKWQEFPSRFLLISGAAILLNSKLWSLCSFSVQSRQMKVPQSKQ